MLSLVSLEWTLFSVPTYSLIPNAKKKLLPLLILFTGLFFNAGIFNGNSNVFTGASPIPRTPEIFVPQVDTTPFASKKPIKFCPKQISYRGVRENSNLKGV